MKKLICALGAAVLLITGCSQTKEPYVRHTFAFDTYITISIYEHDGEYTTGEICDGAASMLAELDDTLSVKKEQSVISKINSGEQSQIDASIYYMLKNCVDLCELTDGAFDITLGNISEMWGFGEEALQKPDFDKLKDYAGKQNYKNIEFDDDSLSMKLKSGDFSLDLGAAAKGYALDMLNGYLVNAGVTSASVDLGGSIMTIGSYNGENWTVSVTSDETNSTAGTLSVGETYIATSNGFNRFVEYDGVKYHHIIDPDTAFPAQSDVKSVTVITANGLIADALSTAFYVMGSEKTEAFIKEYPIADYIIFTTDGQTVISSGITDSYESAQTADE